MNPQTSLVRVIRPVDNFEQIYQGQSVAVPIAFPGSLDFEAGKPNYDPALMNGMSVPLGSRIMLWFPICFNSDDPDAATGLTYAYKILWRLRSAQEYIDDASRGTGPVSVTPYHFGTRELGAPAHNGDPTSRQYIVPVAMETVAFEQTEPGSTYTDGTVNLRGQLIVPDGSPIDFAPLLNSTTPGDVEQGCFPSGNGGGVTGGPCYMSYVCDAQGDEMIIFVRRTSLAPDTWDFTSNSKDRPFSNTYGTDNNTRAVNPNLGIFVITMNM